MSVNQSRPIIAFASQDAWKTWLEEQHAISTGLWLKIAKKESGIPTVLYAEALEVALCFGWIDGQKGAFDGDYWLQLFTPRRPKSKWSKINREKALALIGKGEMQPAGLREVERAQADGRWEAAYEAQRNMTVPDDLQHALDQNDKARAFFSTLDRLNRFAILYRIQDAAKPETRARRIEMIITMLSEARKLYPPRRAEAEL